MGFMDTAAQSAPPGRARATPVGRDPVCGMAVEPGPQKPSFLHDDRTFWFCCVGCRDRFAADPAAYLTAQDPVTGATVDRASAAHVGKHAGRRYFFESADALARFEADPEAYAEPPEPASPGARYICPMCPEVEAFEPSDCPSCGMALERDPAGGVDEGPNPEAVDFTRRLLVAGPLAAVLLTLEMGSHLGAPFRDWIGRDVWPWLQLALAAPVVLYSGAPFFLRAVKSIRNRSPNMWTLIGLGVGAAFAFSLAAALAPGAFPAAFRADDGSVPLYFEAAAVIIALVLLGQILELSARARAGDAIRALLDLAPKTACRLRSDGVDEDVAVDAVGVGDRLRVRHGEAAPVDGRVVEGAAAFDESMLTGEAAPVEKAVGAAVAAGTIVVRGGVIVEAEAVGAETRLARIAALTAAAQRSRAPIQAQVDRVAAWFTPAVVGVASLSLMLWAVFGPEPAGATALGVAVTVLIIACPCALGLATPMSVTVAIGRGAREGVLIRDAEALERLADVDTVVLDKTGTLTEGAPRVAHVFARDGDAARLLRLAASLERQSVHPLAKAVLEAADGDAGPAEAVETRVGAGLIGDVAGRRALVGSEALLRSEGVDPAPLVELAAARRAFGETVVFVAVDGDAAGAIAVGDAIRPTAAAALASLRARGVHVVMATGDAEASARAVADALGVGVVRAGLSPEGKADLVAALQAEGRTIAMAGDGVNDAPALARADVGVAMGLGSDAAIQAAHVTLVGGDLAALERAHRLAEDARANIRHNLVFAFAYNGVGVPIAAGALYPFFGVLLSPMLASAAMSLSSVSVILNALRLGRSRTR